MIGVDARIELMSTIYRLADVAEYNSQESMGIYANEVEDYFAKFDKHIAIRYVVKIGRGYGYDKPMKLAVHLTDPPILEERVAFSFSTFSPIFFTSITIA